MKQQADPTAQTYDEKVIQISRVSKKTKGGNKVGFSVLMVVGDKQGKVGVGLGKAPDVVSAIKKGVKKAKKRMIDFPLDGATIPFAITVKKGAAQVLLKPAPPGSGVIAGGPVRAVVEAAGVRDISSKILGTGNQASNVYATFEALQQIQKLVTLKGIKLKSIAEIEAQEAKVREELQEKHKKRADGAEETKPAKKAAQAESKKPAAKKSDAKKAAPKKAAPKKETAKKTAAKKPAPKATKKTQKK